MLRKILFALAALGTIIVGACSDAPTAERTLRLNGYKNIETTGYHLFGCGKDDMYSTGFKATSPSGEPVEGVVCSALMKGATIRIF